MDKLPFAERLAEGYALYREKTHLPTLVLEAFLNDTLSPEVKDRCSRHIEQCCFCAKSLDILKTVTTSSEWNPGLTFGLVSPKSRFINVEGNLVDRLVRSVRSGVPKADRSVLKQDAEQACEHEQLIGPDEEEDEGSE